MSEEDFDHIHEYRDKCGKHSAETVNPFMNRGEEKLEPFEDCYRGEYDSEEDYARQFVDDCYDLERQMGNLANYFDYEALARELFMCDYYFAGGHVCRAIDRLFRGHPPGGSCHVVEYVLFIMLPNKSFYMCEATHCLIINS